MPADAVYAGDHQTAAGDRVDGDLGHPAAFLVGQRGVLAERTIRPDAAASVAHQEIDVFAELVVVDGQTSGCRGVRFERQCSGDDNATQIHCRVPHTVFLSGADGDGGSSTNSAGRDSSPSRMGAAIGLRSVLALSAKPA